MPKVENGQPKEIHTIETIEELKKFFLYSFYISQTDTGAQDSFFKIVLSSGLDIDPNLLSDEIMNTVAKKLRVPRTHKPIELELQETEFLKQLKILKKNVIEPKLNQYNINNLAHLMFVEILNTEIEYQRKGRPVGGEHKFSSVLHQELKNSNPNFYQNIFVNTLVYSLINAKTKTLNLWSNFRLLCFMFQENNGKMLVPNDLRFSDIMPEFQK